MLANGKKNATAGIGIFSEKIINKMFQRKLYLRKVTNNIAELVAMLEILRFIMKRKIQKSSL